MSNVEDQKKSRTRSPAYPSIGLEEAIQRARTLYEVEDRHLVAVDVAAGHWGYKSGSSAGLQIVSALKQFSLVTEEGSKDRRQIRLSQLALELLNAEDGSKQWRQHVKAAALSPKIHGELWDRYNGRLPSDATLRMFLVAQREPIKFNKTYVDEFIAQFRATIAYSGLDKPDIIPETEQGRTLEYEGPAVNAPASNMPTETAHFSFKGGSSTFMRDLPITLPSLEVAIIRVPFPMSKSDYDTLTNALKGFEPALVASDQGNSEEDRDEESDPEE